VVDASGRDTLLAHQFGDKHKHPRHNSAAIFGHFRGARRLRGAKLEGNISIFWFAHGWFWFIPLADGTTSIGATCWPQYLKSRDKPLKEFFFDTIALAPALADRLRDAELVDDQVHATGNFSYSATKPCGDRWLMLGDAFTFIDPVFSSGVYLAMANAFAGVELVAAELDQPKRVAAARRRYAAHVQRGPRAFSWFIYRMTNPVMRELFMRPKNVLHSKEAVLSVLAGDVSAVRPLARPCCSSRRSTGWAH
jgi:flavin-dependent dehydrogenase